MGVKLVKHRCGRKTGQTPLWTKTGQTGQNTAVGIKLVKHAVGVKQVKHRCGARQGAGMRCIITPFSLVKHRWSNAAGQTTGQTPLWAQNWSNSAAGRGRRRGCGASSPPSSLVKHRWSKTLWAQNWANSAAGGGRVRGCGASSPTRRAPRTRTFTAR